MPQKAPENSGLLVLVLEHLVREGDRSWKVPRRAGRDDVNHTVRGRPVQGNGRGAWDVNTAGSLLGSLGWHIPKLAFLRSGAGNNELGGGGGGGAIVRQQPDTVKSPYSE